MLHLVKLDRSYSPETIAVMTAAFDRICQSLSRRMNDNDDVCRAVALVILRHVDQGESDPLRLSDVAFRELAGFDRSATGMTVNSGWRPRDWDGWPYRPLCCR